MTSTHLIVGVDPTPESRERVRSRTQRIARWSATHRWQAIGLWVVFVIALTSLSFVVSPRQATLAELGVGESGQAVRMVQDAGHVDYASENVLITARSGPLPTGTAAAAAAAVRTGLDGEALVRQVAEPVTSADGEAMLVQVELTRDVDEATDQLSGIQGVVDTVQQSRPQLRVEVVGEASIGHDFDEWLDKDLERAGYLSLPITLAVLLVAFGALVMAGVPVLLGVTSVTSAFGLWALVSQVVPDPGMVLHIILLIGLAVGVDYSLFYVRRFREEMEHGRSPVDSIQVAAATAGHSVVVSGTAVALAMCGLLVVRDAVFTGMGLGAIIVVVVALVSSVTVLPALLVTLARVVDRPRVPLVWRLSSGRGPRLLPVVLKPVVRHPVIAMVIGVIGLGALAVPALSMKTESTQISDYPRVLPTLQAYDRLVAAFPGSSENATVAVTVPGAERAGLPGRVTMLSDAIARHGDLYGPPAPAWYSEDGTTALLEVPVLPSVHSADAQTSITLLREDLVPSTVGADVGARTAVGGNIAEEIDYTDNMRRTLPWVIGSVIGLTFLVMLWSFRSAMLAAITAVLNVLSVGSTFGLLVLVFQGDWAGPLLGFTSTGHVTAWVPVLLFVVLSGLSLDYHIFVVSRIRENAAHGMTASASVSDGVCRTAGVVTAAAAVMIAVFAVFGSMSFIELKQIGIGLSLGVLIDATIIRALALPAMVLVFRRRLWWTRRSGRPGPGAHRPQPSLKVRA